MTWNYSMQIFDFLFLTLTIWLIAYFSLFLAFADVVLHRHRRSLLSGEDKWVFLYFQKGNENHNLKFRNAAPKIEKNNQIEKLEKPKKVKELEQEQEIEIEQSEKAEVGVEFNLPVDLLPFGSWPLSVCLLLFLIPLSDPPSMCPICPSSSPASICASLGGPSHAHLNA